jgi:hypothetical protein
VGVSCNFDIILHFLSTLSKLNCGNSQKSDRTRAMLIIYSCSSIHLLGYLSNHHSKQRTTELFHLGILFCLVQTKAAGGQILGKFIFIGRIERSNRHSTYKRAFHFGKRWTFLTHFFFYTDALLLRNSWFH